MKWLEAFDINENANSVYQFNFHHKPCEKDLLHISVNEFKKIFKPILEEREKINDCKSHNNNENCKNLFLWTMSPPCQPFTLNGNRKDDQDDRTKSFLYLMNEIFPILLPDLIFVENVKNFEISNTRNVLIKQLESFNYEFEEFLICSSQLGLLNQRVRYYLIGRKVNNKNLTEKKKICENVPELLIRRIDNNNDNKTVVVRPLFDYHSVYQSNIDYYNINNILLPMNCSDATVERLQEGNSNGIEKDFIYLNLKQLSKYKGYRYDLLIKRFNNSSIQSAKDCCSCITKSYGQPRFLRGTGPLVLELKEEFSNLTDDEVFSKINFNDIENTLLTLGNVRFLHPLEISRLMTFPPNFQFKEDIQIKQQYKLLGNSVNVLTVAHLIYYLIQKEWNDKQVTLQ
ncbi:hypothetical protein ABK040_010644 [Willaertia magna]